MSADPVLEEFPIEMMEDADVVAKEWIQAQSAKEVVKKSKYTLKRQTRLSDLLETYPRCWIQCHTS